MPTYAANAQHDSVANSKVTTRNTTPNSTQVSPGERTANKPEEQDELNEHQNESTFAQSPNTRREYQDYFSRYPATPQYDHLFLDSEPISPYFRASPKSPAHVPVHPRTQGNQSRFNIPPPKSSSLPPPKFGMSPSFDHQDVDEDAKAAAAALASHEDIKGSSPPRAKNTVSVVSPPEGEAPRKGNPSTEAPYIPYAYAPVGYPPSPIKSTRYPNSSMKSEDVDGSQHPYSHPYYMHPYGPVSGYYYPGDGYYEGYSPMKKPKGDANEDAGEHPPSFRYPPHAHHPYYDKYYHPNHLSGSDSFETDERTAHQSEPGRIAPRGPPPPISKASSYPPPPSPPRYGYAGEGDASASSYPGSRRVFQSPDRSRGYSPYVNPANQDDGSHPRGYGYYEARSPYRYGPPPGYYSPYHEYYRDEERRAESDRSAASPARSTASQKLEDQKHSDDREESATTTPAKNSASSHAQAAIAAGMTEPVSAEEVDFEICNPPLEPIVPPSTTPVLLNNAKISANDVLCGRGGGTNTQVGNRKFRYLVQEFQPTYLLCRRKEKPLIARTIVLIIRKRGGRFLKKNEDDGGYYEVGDEKAEAKTSQALREGLDVRASKVSIEGKKRPRATKKKKDERSALSPSEARDLPPHVDPYGYPIPPPHAYFPYPYGADPYYGAPVPYGYPPPPGQYSPSRKRPRQPTPPDEGQDPHYSAYPYKSGYPYPPYQNVPPQHHDHHQYVARPGQDEAGREEENPMWEMDFSPPRTSIPREHGEH